MNDFEPASISEAATRTGPHAMSPATRYISAVVARLSHSVDSSPEYQELLLDEELAEWEFIHSLPETRS